MSARSWAVTTSRAGLISPEHCLPRFKLAGPVFAAIDVYEEEPMLDVNYSFFSLGTVVCAPHIGYVARDEYEIQFPGISTRSSPTPLPRHRCPRSQLLTSPSLRR